MPTATVIDEFWLVNLGPLTTTFTAPSSCVTASASRFGIGLADAPFYGSQLSEECGLGRYMYTGSDTACLPYPLPYHSPGNACPSGWTTAATMTVDADGEKTVSFDYDPAITSAFLEQQENRNPDADADFVMRVMPPVSIFVEALGLGETGIACCPSGYSAEPYGLCYSTAPISLYTATTACEVILLVEDVSDQTIRTEFVTIHGQTGTALIFGYNDSADFTTSTMHYTFADPEETLTGHDGAWLTETPRAVVYVEDMVLLASGGAAASEPTEAPEASETSVETESASTGSATPTGDVNSAAESLRGGLAAKVVGIAVAAAAAACVVGL
ncbi:hypothetical protein F5X68DRAFT_263732 [Plectosphaerella plurivora]|uniref:Uncharacterized protein n=1 Tax=Plectosphaerella plurivora TaxID=936078 RepID=A0A9P9A998_9PEZI|nr:hypothetical protein F5X68DRAFT_263732 [Plectosphaerella plurivora]